MSTDKKINPSIDKVLYWKIIWAKYDIPNMEYTEKLNHPWKMEAGYLFELN